MSLLPDTDRILLGPGPSLTAPRVMRAMAAPTLSHLDPLMMALLDDIRARQYRDRRQPGTAGRKIWRIGLMGASSTRRLILLLLGALESAFAQQGRQIHA